MAGGAGLGKARHGGARHGRRGVSFYLGFITEGMTVRIQSIKWKNGVPSRDLDASACFDALERIRKRTGSLTDDAIIEAAKNVRSPLHDWFEWSDNAAAAEYRRSQARSLIRSLEVTYHESPESPVRAYSVLKKERPKSEMRTAYSTTDEVLRDPSARDRLIADAIRFAMDFRRRFKMLHELRRVIEEIEKMIEEVAVTIEK